MTTSTSKPRSKLKSKSTSKPRTKSKSKPRAKAKAAPKVEANPKVDLASKSSTTVSGGTTCFDVLTWGMSLSEVAERYQQRVKPGDKHLHMKRTLNGFPTSVSFHFDENGLYSIDVSGLNTYANWGDGDDDEFKLLNWIEEKAGPFTTRDPASVIWNLPTVNIRTYCDESLGAVFEMPKP